VFAAAYLLWLYQRTAFGTVPTEWTGGGHSAHAVGADVNDEHEGFHIKDVTPVEWISWTPMLVLIAALGVFPNLLFRIFDPAVTRLVDHLGNFIK